jgi:cysteine-rich repeat protein
MRKAILLVACASLFGCGEGGGDANGALSTSNGAGGAVGSGTGGGGRGSPQCGDGETDPGEECDDGNALGDDACLPTCTRRVPVVTKTFEASDDDLLNPERGFYHAVDLLDGGDASHVRREGSTLAYAGVILDAFRDQPIDAATLDALDAGLSAVRDARIKVVLRFAYNDDGGDDAPKSIILQHLEQLAPLLDENADVIAVVQAGLIGGWGEWHSSSNGLDNPLDRGDILAGLLDAVPETRMVQIRTPMFKDEALPGGPLDAGEAWRGTDRARVGHHNDCFLASTTDLGTYADPVESWKDYVGADGRFTPVGGETCSVNPPRSACAEATAEMADLHWSFLNLLYHQGVLDGWRNPADGGPPCYEAIRRGLGYRVEITRASWSEAVAPGGALGLEVTLVNRGYAAMFNERPLYVVLGKGDERRAARLAAVDARRFAPGEEVTVRAWLRVPATVPPGDHRLALWLPDAATSLREMPEYAVAMANQEVWDPATGENVLDEALLVDPRAKGAVDLDATEFAEIR